MSSKKGSDKEELQKDNSIEQVPLLDHDLKTKQDLIKQKKQSVSIWQRIKKQKRKDSDGNATDGRNLYSNIYNNRQTKIYFENDEAEENEEESRKNSEIVISYDKMRNAINKNHPRIYEDKVAKKIRLCVDIGSLKDSHKNEHFIMDELGIGISIYFKLLKSIIRFFVVLSICCIPLFYIYSRGNFSSNVSTSAFMVTMLGNLGQDTYNCNQQDLRYYQSITLQCTASKISSLIYFGLQKKDAKSEDNDCQNLDPKGQFDLELDEDCRLSTWQKSDTDKIYADALEEQFHNCENQASCTINLDSSVFPKQCNDKMAERWDVDKDPNAVKKANDAISKCIADKGDQCELTYNYQAFFTFNCKSEKIQLLPDNYDPVKRETIGLIIVGIDVFIMFIFILALWFLQYYINSDRDRHKRLLIETRDFSLEFWQLPKLTETYTLNMLKADLWDHIETNIKGCKQQIKRLENTNEDQNCEIVDIQFGMSNYQHLGILVDIQAITIKIMALDLKIKKLKKQSEMKDSKKKAKIEKQIANYEIQKENKYQRIDVLTARYQQETNKLEIGQAKSAIVLFRSMEGVKRAHSQFKCKWYHKFQWYCCCCLKSQRLEKIRFHDTFMKIKHAVEPDLILWHNFGISSKNRCLRTLFFVIFSLGLLTGCFYGILKLEKFIQATEQAFPSQLICNKTINLADAEVDAYNFINKSTSQTGDFYCFCYQQYQNNSHSLLYLQTIKFPNYDDRALCFSEWYRSMTRQTLISLFTPLSMGIVNVLVEVLIQVGSMFTRPLNEETNLLDSVNGIAAIQTINLGTTLICVSIQYEGWYRLLGFKENPIPGLLDGWYNGFTSAWYNNFGAQIIVTFIIEIGVPHINPLLMYVVFQCWRKCDRKCTKDKSNTKQLLQSNYEWLHTGPEYVWDARLAQVVCLIWVTFQYCVSLPICMVFTLLNFIGMYWIDKWLVLRFHRIPKNYDSQPIDRVIYLCKFTIIFHFLFGMLFLSNNDIITNDHYFENAVNNINQFLRNVFNFQDLQIPTQFNSKHIVIFFLCEIGLIILIGFEEFFIKLVINYLWCIRKYTKKYEFQQAISDDYYGEIHSSFLLNEFQRCKLELKRIKKMLQKMKRKSGKNELQANLQSLGTQLEKQQEEKENWKIDLFTKQQDRFEKKKLLLEQKIFYLGEKIQYPKKNIVDQVKILRKKETEITAFFRDKLRIKSTIQTYDIRDADDYQGVLELERLIMENQDDKTNKNRFTENMKDRISEFMKNNQNVQNRKSNNSEKYNILNRDTRQSLVQILESQDPETKKSIWGNIQNKLKVDKSADQGFKKKKLMLNGKTKMFNWDDQDSDSFGTDSDYDDEEDEDQLQNPKPKVKMQALIRYSNRNIEEEEEDQLKTVQESVHEDSLMNETQREQNTSIMPMLKKSKNNVKFRKKALDDDEDENSDIEEEEKEERVVIVKENQMKFEESKSILNDASNDKQSQLESKEFNTGLKNSQISINQSNRSSEMKDEVSNTLEFQDAREALQQKIGSSLNKNSTLQSNASQLTKDQIFQSFQSLDPDEELLKSDVNVMHVRDHKIQERNLFQDPNQFKINIEIKEEEKQQNKRNEPKSLNDNSTIRENSKITQTSVNYSKEPSKQTSKKSSFAHNQLQEKEKEIIQNQQEQDKENGINLETQQNFNDHIQNQTVPSDHLDSQENNNNL